MLDEPQTWDISLSGIGSGIVSKAKNMQQWHPKHILNETELCKTKPTSLVSGDFCPTVVT